MARHILRLRQVSSAAVFFALSVSCSTDSELRPFTSDGCSLFPDASLISNKDWCSCCFEHDISYWQGGTEDERKAADELLRECVTEKTGDRILAGAMYDGVRLGGSPYFFNWYRWGYGWGYERKYQALTVAEKTRAEGLLTDYFAANPADVCDQ